MLYKVAPDGERTACVRMQNARHQVLLRRVHAKLIAKFYRAIEQNTDDYIHVRDALMSIRLIDAVQKAGRTGETVRL